MAIPDPPTITQKVPTTGDPVPADTLVADVFSVGASTYAVTFGDDKFDIGGDQDNEIVTLSELDGAFHIEVTATNGDGTSEPGSGTLIFADNENPWDDTPNPYPGNPLIPPPFPNGAAPDIAWRMYQARAIAMLVPRARDGVDYAVVRTDMDSPANIVDWNATLLGACPTTEIEALARDLAAADPLPYIP
jgi:hypothetical protein